MPVDNPCALPAPETPAAISAGLVRSALKAALGSLDEGHPYASLVLVATDPDGAPLLLISGLARHTRNLKADARASLLFDGTGQDADPLSGPRVTLRGRAVPTGDPVSRRRFLARHPSAEGYASFADFGMWRLEVSDAHFIGGFGRIIDVARDDLLVPTGEAAALIAAEPDIVAHMNADHMDAVQVYATRLAGEDPGDWRVSGIDPAGLDLVAWPRAARIPFESLVRTPGDARKALVILAEKARSLGSERATKV
ncbi:MAG: HugZ family protein [Hyphomicrobiales bacterium]|nr:MAG: HugZ family protein [Hyphomicrobiales bacterium]